MTLGEHLDELRRRLFRSTIAIALAFIACWGFREQLDHIVQQPYKYAAAELNAELEVRAQAAITAEGASEEEWRNLTTAASTPRC